MTRDPALQKSRIDQVSVECIHARVPMELLRLLAGLQAPWSGHVALDGVELRALGLCVPPPYMQAFADRHPALVSRLQTLDNWIGAWPGIRNFGDHFLVVLRRR